MMIFTRTTVYYEIVLLYLPEKLLKNIHRSYHFQSQEGI